MSTSGFTHSPFKQIAVCRGAKDEDGHSEDALYALDAEGVVWYYRDDKARWCKLPDKREE
jgi:hypothetical protein